MTEEIEASTAMKTSSDSKLFLGASTPENYTIYPLFLKKIGYINYFRERERERDVTFEDNGMFMEARLRLERGMVLAKTRMKLVKIKQLKNSTHAPWSTTTTSLSVSSFFSL